MAGKRSANRLPVRVAEPLYRDVRAVLDAARSSAFRAVNRAMVEAYWHVGRLIVEHEQGGRRRAAYGLLLLEDLSRRLTVEFGRGFDVTNLRSMRRFYTMFEIRDAARLESAGIEGGAAQAATSVASGRRVKIRNAVRSESSALESRGAAPAPVRRSVAPVLRSELSWTHYRLLLRVQGPEARTWYMNEAADQQWSSRQLERQISVLYYERLVASRQQAPVRKEARDKLSAVAPDEFIRDPYVLEFLDLKDYPALRESAVEQAIVDNLQDFLLELGKGFSFVARQKRMRFDDEDFYVDLVFYNYLLKCFVLIDLKVGKLTHQDIGQMDGYVRVFDAHARPEGDNPTIGLILCSKKNEAIARYSVLGEGRQIFAAKYLQVLPSEADLTRELERERRRFDARRREARER